MDAASRLEEIKAQLSADQLRYINERILCRTDAEAARNCGFSPTAVYHWPEKDIINEAVRLIVADGLDASRQILQRALVEAAQVKVGGLKSRKQTIAQSAATEILDRFHGKPRQQSDVNITGGPLSIVLTWGDTEAESADVDGDSADTA